MPSRTPGGPCIENVLPLPVEPYANMQTLFMSRTESAMSLTELNKSFCEEFGPAYTRERRRREDVEKVGWAGDAAWMQR